MPSTGQGNVWAYLPEWRYDGANFASICRVVTHLILFSIEVTPEGKLSALDRLPRKNILADARASCGKVLICVGGNGRSAGFSRAVASPKRRARFIGELLALCERLGLDGVDYNWEYPGVAMRIETRAVTAAHEASDASSDPHVFVPHLLMPHQKWPLP